MARPRCEEQQLRQELQSGVDQMLDSRGPLKADVKQRLTAVVASCTPPTQFRKLVDDRIVVHFTGELHKAQLGCVEALVTRFAAVHGASGTARLDLLSVFGDDVGTHVQRTLDDWIDQLRDRVGRRVKHSGELWRTAWLKSGLRKAFGHHEIGVALKKFLDLSIATTTPTPDRVSAELRCATIDTAVAAGSEGNANGTGSPAAHDVDDEDNDDTSPARLNSESQEFLSQRSRCADCEPATLSAAEPAARLFAPQPATLVAESHTSPARSEARGGSAPKRPREGSPQPSVEEAFEIAERYLRRASKLSDRVRRDARLLRRMDDTTAGVARALVTPTDDSAADPDLSRDVRRLRHARSLREQRVQDSVSALVGIVAAFPE